MTAVDDRLPVWQVYRDCLRAWRRDFWSMTLLAGMVLAPLLIVEFALYGAADISVTTDDSLSLWIVSLPVFVYSVESHHFLSAVIERLEGAERHGHPAPTIGALLRDLPWVNLFWADMAYTAILVVGAAALLVPALILGTWYVLVMPLINMERQPVIATFRRSHRLVRGNFWRVAVVWIPISVGASFLGQVLGELLDDLGHSQLVHIVAHLVPEMVLLPIAALPAVIMTFVLVDIERGRDERAPGGVMAPTIRP
jgi:uncharacterized membrane protein YhaH (DUF805 family)